MNNKQNLLLQRSYSGLYFAHKVASQQDPLFRDVSQQDTTNEGFSKPANKVKKLTNKKSIVDDTDGLKDPEKDSPKQEILPSKEEKGVRMTIWKKYY